MLNTNNTMQTQTSNTLHNAIMEAGGKDHPPMLAPGSTKTTTERYMENYNNVSQDIHDQLNAEVEAIQIILTGIDNDIYSTVDTCPNACEMWKAIERLKQEVTPDAADNSGPIFDSEPLQKVPNNDNYNVFAIKSEHPEQSKSVNDTYPIEQDEHNVINYSLDMSYEREKINHDDDDDLSNEHDLLASLIEKLKYEIDDNKNRNKFLETSNEH
nr:hypothetical protein [Tanacetum cinerariifolium]GEZ48232.1 hypothetical protein [Tanacetum cinerariifolium]